MKRDEGLDIVPLPRKDELRPASRRGNDGVVTDLGGFF